MMNQANLNIFAVALGLATVGRTSQQVEDMVREFLTIAIPAGATPEEEEAYDNKVIEAFSKVGIDVEVGDDYLSIFNKAREVEVEKDDDVETVTKTVVGEKRKGYAYYTNSRGDETEFRIATKEDVVVISNRLAKVISASIVLDSKGRPVKAGEGIVVVMDYIPMGGDQTQTLQFQTNTSFLKGVRGQKYFGDLYLTIETKQVVKFDNLFVNLDGTQKIKGKTTFVVSPSSNNYLAIELAAREAGIEFRGKVWDSSRNAAVDGIVLIDNADVPFSFSKFGKAVSADAKQVFENWIASDLKLRDKMVVETQFTHESELKGAEHRKNHAETLKADAKLKAEIGLAAIDAQVAAYNKLVAGGMSPERAEAIAFK